MTSAPEQATVVVGVKETGASRAAIRLAAREARYRGAELVAMMAYHGEPALGAPAGRPLSVIHSADDGRAVAESALRVAVVDALGDQAQGVLLRTAPGLAGRTLVDTARMVGAQLIVLAGRGGGGDAPGSVSQYVLCRSPCPVLVVPAGGGTT